MKADKISKFLFIFLLSFYNFPSFLTLDNSFIIDSIKNENSKWEDVKNEFAKGQMRGFVKYNEVISLLNDFLTNFPDQINLVESLGETIEKRKIYHIRISNKPNIDDVPAMLFTGLHHAREPLSLTMNLYIMAKVLFDFFHNCYDTKEVLSNSMMIFVPAVNVDGYQRITEIFESSSMLNEDIRKNRRPFQECESNNFGVDLNRNYDYEFANDNEGSSGYTCAEDYRGSHPFSEPETQAIRDLVLEFGTKLKIAVNFHAYGNLWIIPFNYDKDKNNLIIRKMKKQMKIYDEMKNDAKFTATAVFGNAENLVKYVANGEATDWMFGKQGIISLSPELGDDNLNSNRFYPDKSEIIPILDACLPPIQYLINTMKFNPKFDFAKFYDSTDLEKFSNFNKIENQNLEVNLFGVQIFNKGMIDYTIQKFHLDVVALNHYSQKINILGVFYTFFEDDESNNSSDSSMFSFINGKYSTNDIKNFSNLLSINIKATDEDSYDFIFNSSFDFKSRSYLKLYFLIGMPNLEKIDSLLYSLMLNLHSQDSYLKNIINMAMIFPTSINENVVDEEIENPLIEKIGNNGTFLGQNKTISRPQQHLKFLTWSILSLIILVCFIFVLAIIICIWKKRKSVEETKSLLKNTKTKLSNNSQIQEEHRLSQNQIFVIGNENVPANDNFVMQNENTENSKE